MVKENRFKKFFLIIFASIIILILYNNRLFFSYLYKYTKKHFSDKYIYTNKFDKLINYRKCKYKYILLSENDSLLKKMTLPELLNNNAVVLYFYPSIKTNKDIAYERKLKMIFYKGNFLIKKNGFIITTDSIPSSNNTFISEFVADSLFYIKRVYSNDAYFFRALNKVSIWLPIETDTLFSKKINAVYRFVRNNRAVVVYSSQSPYYERYLKDKKFLYKLFQNKDTFQIRQLIDGIVIYNKIKYLQYKKQR